MKPKRRSAAQPGAKVPANLPGAGAESIPGLFVQLEATEAKTRYAALKALRLASETNPAALYPHFDRFVALLGSENNIFRWGAIIVLGNLAGVDSEGKLAPMLDRFLAPIAGPSLVTAGNTIGAAARIALAQPPLADRIARAVLKAEKGSYPTPECRNVVIGHALKALDSMFETVADPAPILALARRQTRNRRAAVQARARALLKRRTPEAALPG